MSFLLDTNVISEIGRGVRCDPAVAAWFEQAPSEQLHLSVLVTGEIRKGVELVRQRDLAKARALAAWLAEVEAAFGPRILPIDRAVADAWGVMHAVRTVPVVDGLLAATARVFDLTLVTRNARDVSGLGARVFDPFTA